MPLFVVASETGGQVLGAFDGYRMIGFTMAVVGLRGRKPFLHSHMTAVLDAYRDRGAARRLKLFQREDALSRGIELGRVDLRPAESRERALQFSVGRHRAALRAESLRPHHQPAARRPSHGPLGR